MRGCQAGCDSATEASVLWRLSCVSTEQFIRPPASPRAGNPLRRAAGRLPADPSAPTCVAPLALLEEALHCPSLLLRRDDGGPRPRQRDQSVEYGPEPPSASPRNGRSGPSGVSPRTPKGRFGSCAHPSSSGSRSVCLGPPNFSSINGTLPATVGDHPTARSRGEWRCDCSRPLEPYGSR